MLVVESAIAPEMLGGVHSGEDPYYGTGHGILFPYTARDGSRAQYKPTKDKNGTRYPGGDVFIFRPDEPRDRENKYLGPPGFSNVDHLTPERDYSRILAVEGTKQGRAVASWAPEDWAVISMQGCNGIHAKTDLSWVKPGAEVVLAFDADWQSNDKVRSAATKTVPAHFHRAGAGVVRALNNGGHGTQGADDVLAALPESERQGAIQHWIDRAVPVGKRQVTMRRASEIPKKHTDWLWAEQERFMVVDGVRVNESAHYLPAGELCLLTGREGVGKSTIALWIAAQLTRGTLPGIYEGTPKTVVVYAAEDDIGRTINPRLEAAGADMDRVQIIIEVTSIEGMETVLDMPEDKQRLTEACADPDVVLLILDPLVSVVNAGLDTHKDAEVRRALHPLTSFAHDTSTTVLGLIHENKSQGVDLRTRVMGSRAFTAVPRSILACAKDNDAEGEGYQFGQIKANLAASVPFTQQYTLVSGRVPGEHGPISTSRVEWGDRVTERMDDRVTRQEAVKTKPTKVDEAAEWLVDYLTEHGPTPRTDVRNIVGKMFGRNSLDNAAKQVCVFPHRLVDPEQGSSGGVLWELPTDTREGER